MQLKGLVFHNLTLEVEISFFLLNDSSKLSMFKPLSIVENGEKVVLFQLMCGLFNQTKFLPLRFMQGLQVELEVVNQFSDVCTTSITQPVNVPNPQAGQPNQPATILDNVTFGVEGSQTWVILEPMIKCDVISLDNQLDNEYTDHLMQGKTLPINFASFVHQVQSIG